MTHFGRTLWRFMQDRPEGELNRGELEELLNEAGLEAAEGSVSAWLNGTRFPPPGLVYYSAEVLGLSYEQRCELAWAYFATYKNRRRGKQNVNKVSKQTPENIGKIGAKRREYEERTERMRQEEDSHRTGDRN
jgi:hypothetical protein